MTRILVPIDGSSSSKRVLPTVKRFASMMNADVIFVYVLDQRDSVNQEANSVSTAEETLEALVSQEFPAAGTMVCEAKTAVRGVLDVIEDESIDLVIMSTHGSNCAREQAMGSVARDLVRTSAVPVMLVGLAAIPQPLGVRASSAAK